MRRFEHGGDTFGHPDCLDFSASLNPLGMPEAAQRTLEACAQACVTYPDPRCRSLTAAIAAHEGVPTTWVVPCAGATDAFWRLCLVARPAQALVCAPCYSGYEEALVATGTGSATRIRYHRLHACEDFVLTTRFASNLTEEDDLAFIANPNNPTGRCVPRNVLEACLCRSRDVHALMVLDECFIELTEQAGSTALLANHPNLVLVKALTKSHCLAGLRVGYLLCADEGLARRLRQVGQPWAISTPAQLAGTAALKDAAFMRKSVVAISLERERMRKALQFANVRVIPSDANFLLLHGPEGLVKALGRHKILARSCQNFVGLNASWLRVAVRTREENDRLLDAMHLALEEVTP